MNLAQAKQAWTDILVGGRDMAPTEAIIRDLIEYSGLSEADVRTLATTSQQLTEQKWDEADRSTAEGLRDFYRSVSNWVFGTLNYHAKQAESDDHPLPVQTLAALDGRAPGDHLDFGAGNGTASLLFARAGWRPIIADVSPPLLDFARWRCERADVAARFIDLNEQGIGEGQYDLITAFNTFAHIPDIEPTLRDLHAALRPGGLLIFDIDAREQTRGNEWFFFNSALPVLRPLRAIGFKKCGRIGAMYVFERVELSPAKRATYSLVDGARYSKPAQHVLRALREMRSALQQQRSVQDMN